ncbi:sulfite oxidase [Trifolium repens]|nr:sulfite oxidase [Trifolium repens]
MKFAKEVFVTSNCEVIDHTIPDCSSVVDLSYDTDSDVNVGISILFFYYDEKVKLNNGWRDNYFLSSQSLITANEKKALCSQTSLILQVITCELTNFGFFTHCIGIRRSQTDFPVQCVICSLEDVSTIKLGRLKFVVMQHQAVAEELRVDMSVDGGKTLMEASRSQKKVIHYIADDANSDKWA